MYVCIYVCGIIICTCDLCMYVFTYALYALQERKKREQFLEGEALDDEEDENEVCMYVCMHLCMYVCMYVYSYMKVYKYGMMNDPLYLLNAFHKP